VASPLSLGFGIMGTTHVHLQWDPPRCVFGSKRARLPCQGLPPTLADPGVQGHLADQQHPMVTAVEVERLVWRRTDAAWASIASPRQGECRSSIGGFASSHVLGAAAAWAPIKISTRRRRIPPAAAAVRPGSSGGRRYRQRQWQRTPVEATAMIPMMAAALCVAQPWNPTKRKQILWARVRSASSG
jgi:hypothetical protein